MKNPLDNAIQALELASQCGGELDLEIYAKAHQELVAMRNAILTHNHQRNEKIQAPDGKDYNKLWSLLGLQREPGTVATES